MILFNQTLREKGKESGGAGFLIVLILSLAIGSGFVWSFLDDLIYSLAYAKQSMYANQIAANMTARVRDLLASKQSKDPTLNCVKAKEVFKVFQDFTTTHPQMVFSQDDKKDVILGCIIKEVEAKAFDKYKVTIIETEVNSKNLHKSIKVQVDMKTKKNLTTFDSKGKALKRGPSDELISRPIKRDKEYLLSMAKLSKFNVIFTGKPASTPLVNAPDGVDVTFTGLSYFSRKDPIQAKQIVKNLDTPNILFKAPFYVRGASIMSTSSVFSQKILLKAFPKGIETSIANEDKVDDFLPKNNDSWNFRIDYGLYKDGRYPLPEVRGGSVIENCSDIPGDFSGDLDAKQRKLLEAIFKNDSKIKTFTVDRASYTSLPTSADQGFPTLAQTCHYDTENIGIFVHMGQNRNLKLLFSPNDNVFCGAVVAETLNIDITSPGQYALFGYFVVGRINISAPSGTEIYFYNPSDQRDPVVPFPSERETQDLLAMQLNKLGSNVIKNLFIPIARSEDTPYRPYAPKEFLQSCGGGVYAFKTQYPAIHEEDAFKSKVLTNQIDAIFFIEDIL